VHVLILRAIAVNSQQSAISRIALQKAKPSFDSQTPLKNDNRMTRKTALAVPITRSPDHPISLVPIPVMMMATLARLVQLMTPSLGLGAMLAVPADGFLQVLFSSVNPPLAFTIVIPVVRPGGNRTCKEAERDQRGDPQFGFKQDLSHDVSLFE
jgi:hypothetical protein